MSVLAPWGGGGGGASWLVEQIDVRAGRVELSWRGSPAACLSASEWTGIYYLSPLPTIKPVMSWFNSLGKQAYRSHVSINVNYPGSCLHFRVPPLPRPTGLAPGWSSMECNMFDVNAASSEEYGVCCVVQKIKTGRPSVERRLIWILRPHGYRSANGSVPNHTEIADQVICIPLH